MGVVQVRSPLPFGFCSSVQPLRLARDLMRLCLLMARHFVPYGKWLGSAFAGLPGAATTAHALAAAMSANAWPEREASLSAAYELIAEQHNALALTPPLDARTRPYYQRRFQVIGGDRFAEALLASLGDDVLAAATPVGAVDQFIDSTDVLTDPHRARAAAAAVLGDIG